MTHDTSHEELLQMMLAGDLPPDSQRTRERLEGCTECARQWREMQFVVASIDSADRERREVLAEVAVDRRSPGSELVAATLEEERRKSFGSSPRSRTAVSRLRAVLLAAAVVLAGLFIVRALRPVKPMAPDTSLGIAIRFADEYTTLSPGVPIRWSFGGNSERASFHVQLRGRSEDGTSRSEDIPVRDAEWTPDHEQLTGVRGKVRLWVEAFDRPVNGELLGTSPVITPTVSR